MSDFGGSDSTDLVQRTTDFKPRSAGLFYQVAVTEALAKDRTESVIGCLDVLLALAEDLEPFRVPLQAIHACLEDAVFDGPCKPHFKRVAELESDVQELESATNSLQTQLEAMKDQRSLVLPEIDKLNAKIREQGLEIDSLTTQLAAVRETKQGMADELAGIRHLHERKEQAMIEVVAEHREAALQSEAQVMQVHNELARFNSKADMLTRVEEQVVKASGCSELVRRSHSSEIVEIKLLERQLWTLIEVQFQEFSAREAELTPGSNEMLRMQRQSSRHVSAALRELEALRGHVEATTGRKKDLESEHAALEIGTKKHRPKVLVSCDGGNSFLQVTPPTTCSLCGESLASCPHRRYGKGMHLLWAIELPQGATHMRMSWMPEAELDAREAKKKPGSELTSLEIGPLWDEFKRVQGGPILQPIITNLLTAEALQRIISQFHEHLVASESDPEVWANRTGGDSTPMEQLLSFLASKYGDTMEVAMVQLYYVLKSSAKRQSRQRIALFIDVLTQKVGFPVWIQMESCAKVVTAAMPTEAIEWTSKLEEALLTRVFGEVASVDKITRMRAEFSYFRMTTMGKASADEPDNTGMRDWMIEFVCELTRTYTDPFHELWSERIAYEAPKGTVLAPDLVVALVLKGIELPATFTHAKALLTEQLEAAQQFKKIQVSKLKLQDTLGKPVTSELSLLDVAAVAACFQSVHIVHTRTTGFLSECRRVGKDVNQEEHEE